jgi:hypothetical protein
VRKKSLGKGNASDKRTADANSVNSADVELVKKAEPSALQPEQQPAVPSHQDKEQAMVEQVPLEPLRSRRFHLALLKATGNDVIRSAETPVKSFIVAKVPSSMERFGRPRSSSSAVDGHEERSLYLKVDLMDLLLSLLTQGYSSRELST